MYCTHLSLTVSQLFELQLRKCKKSPFSRTAAHIFVWTPGDAPALITQYVAWVEREFNACQTPRSMYLSIFNSFRVIRCSSQCVSPKIAIFTYCSRHFCFPWRRPCDYHTMCCMDGKTIQCLPNPSQHVPIYFQHFPSYSNCKCKKSQFSSTAAHIFVSPDYHAICCMDGKTIQCLPNPSQHVPIYLQ